MAIIQTNPIKLLSTNGTVTQSTTQVDSNQSTWGYSFKRSNYQPSSFAKTGQFVRSMPSDTWTDVLRLTNGYSITIMKDSRYFYMYLKDPNNNMLLNITEFGISYENLLYVDVMFFEQENLMWWGLLFDYQENVYQGCFSVPNKTISEILNGSVAPDYIWKPFYQLSGNSGQFLMNLSLIDESIIGDGSTQTGTSDASKFYINELTSLYDLTVNMLDGQETTIIYCGRNYLTATKRTVVGTQSTIIYVTLKFYFRTDVLIYTTPEIAMTITGTASPNTYYLSIIYDTENEVAAPDLINKFFVVSDYVYYYNNFALPSNVQMNALYIWLQDNGQEQEYITPYDTGTTDNGGNPTLPRPQDHITDSPMPTCGGLDSGIVTLYRPTPTQVADISDFLWSTDVLDNFKKYFNNFADNIMSLYSLPFTPENLPTKSFTVGKMISETITNVEYCTVRYFDIDMGELELQPRWSSYLDYSPYTKCELYLPYLGLHSLDVDELMSPAAMNGTLTATQGCTLKLIYRLDILTGVIVAKLKINGEIRYQFSGKVGTNIPLTGQIYNNLIGSIVTAGAGLIGTIATGGLTAPMTVPAAVTATVQAQKPAVTRIGNISGDASMLATNVPYLCITNPNKPLLEKQEDFTGFPSYKSGILSNFSGYTQVLDAHVEGISCTEDERNMILSYLKNGVII